MLLWARFRSAQFDPFRSRQIQTGLTGKYDFKLRYVTDELHNTDPDTPPGFFTAAQQELGLKFEPTKDPVEVLVIDHIDRPSEN
jgi:uncharacterized protein (TIGR03435 family)